MRQNIVALNQDLDKSLAKIRDEYAGTLIVPKPAGNETKAKMLNLWKAMISRPKQHSNTTTAPTARAESNQSMKEMIISPDENGKMNLYKMKSIPVILKDRGSIKVRSLQRVETDKANTILESISANDVSKSNQLTQILKRNNANVVATTDQSHVENRANNYLGMQNVNINLQCHDLFGLGYLTDGLRGLAQIHATLLAKLPYWGFIAAVTVEFAILTMIVWQVVRVVSLFVMAGTLTHEVTSDTWFIAKTIVQGTAKGIAGVIKYVIG